MILPTSTCILADYTLRDQGNDCRVSEDTLVPLEGRILSSVQGRSHSVYDGIVFPKVSVSAQEVYMTGLVRAIY